MAAGKPFIYVGDEDSEIDIYIQKYNCGWSYSWRQKTELKSFLNKISYDDMELFIEKGINSKNAVETHYKKEDVLKLF